MICAFQEDDHQPQRMHMIVLPGAGLDLSKLALVGELVDMLEAGEISLSEGTARLDEIKRTPVPWGRIANAFGYAFVGAGLAVLFSCGWWDVLFSTRLSLLVYGMVLLSGSFGWRTAEWLPLSSAFVVAAMATADQFVWLGL